MSKYLFVLMIFTEFVSAQNADYKRMPNSYVYDINLAKTNNYGGLYIPVKKAYSVWTENAYLMNNGSANVMPSGILSAEMVWEDVPGIIRSVTLNNDSSNPSNSKIKVNINNGLGNGNAVVAFKINDQTYWSWHIWITDNPENGVNYSQGFELDIDKNPITVQYMDRNLGALGKDFLGNNWQKSGGLMYQWGRKDPFPPLVFKDENFYEINSALGSLVHNQIGGNKIPVVLRPSTDISTNIKFSVQNPLNYIINSDSGNWFSSSLHKTPGSGTSYTAWDLWADNYRGENSNASSSNTAIATDSKSYELKSEFDPCPNGWRIPSHYGRVTTVNNHSPFGRKSYSSGDDATYPTLLPTASNPYLDGIKVYPGLGMDFTNSQNGVRNLGIMPMAGAYVYYPNSVAPTAPVSIIYQDENATSSLWEATFSYDGARAFYLISDALRTTSSVGLHSVYINQSIPSKAGSAVRCMRDPNILKIGNFPTEYFNHQNQNYIKGLDNPNTYLITNQTQLDIPVSKAFSVHNQLFSNQEMLPSNHLVAKVLWATNPNMVTGIRILPDASDVRESVIQLDINPNEKGNFVVSLHNDNTTNPSYWSWLVWVPSTDPTINKIKYITEQPIPTQYHFINPTKSTMPPLVTNFMDRNLGALEVYQNSSNSAFINRTKSLLFQWGRKDALPQFSAIKNPASGKFENIIFIGSENQTDNGTITFNTINNSQYLANYTKEFSAYNPTTGNKYQKIIENIKYSVQNPLLFLYRQGLGQLFDGGNPYSNDLTKVRDWVSDDRSQADFRWGHANKKSVFDPCPEGWRVPDVSLSSLYVAAKGNSPFYNSYKSDWAGKPGVLQSQWHNVTTYYNGISYPTGWTFTSQVYPLGNFPADAIRGEIGGNDLDSARSGIWTASLADLHTGFALSMMFQGSTMQTGTGSYPQAAMGVRCAKDEGVRLLQNTAAYINQSLNMPSMISPNLPIKNK